MVRVHTSCACATGSPLVHTSLKTINPIPHPSCWCTTEGSSQKKTMKKPTSSQRRNRHYAECSHTDDAHLPGAVYIHMATRISHQSPYEEREGTWEVRGEKGKGSRFDWRSTHQSSISSKEMLVGAPYRSWLLLVSTPVVPRFRLRPYPGHPPRHSLGPS